MLGTVNLAKYLLAVEVMDPGEEPTTANSVSEF